jgi:hypothetical protein
LSWMMSTDRDGHCKQRQRLCIARERQRSLV